jgi:hypothetical protein
MRFCLLLILLGLCCMDVVQAQENEEHHDSDLSVLTLNKDQLAALAVAIREMRKSGRSFRGQQVRIEDQRKNFHITFMDDPINMGVAGSQNGITWEIRKSELKVLRWFLDR